jgi:hypothetical protein
MQLKMEDNDFVERLVFCDEATFHISGKVNMLHQVWDEFDYRVDVCRVTQGAHIEGLRVVHEKFGQLQLLTV